ncbi:MAG: phospho-N-acetylmuramoyl-pentapeptide-transferase [Acidobacteriota bacterium]|jgi:phospho-N-acetylmuramoyl-pentapeptide-transferase|nr:phospho-N-acetylmuramoyl-pentapeptide-transferase [Acidobacteriota bacterium]
MLYELLINLQDVFSPLNVFRYITFRTALSAVTALSLTLLFAPSLIRWLKAKQVGQRIRSEGPPDHNAKAGTPTIGGILIVGSISISTLLWMELSNRLVWVALGSTLAFAILGFIDDYLHVIHPRRRGLSVRAKFMGEITIGVAVGTVLWWLSNQDMFSTQLAFPFFKEMSPFLGWMYLPFATLVLVAASNAVNLTDGLDGLATGSTLIAAGAFVAFAYLAGHNTMAEYLNIIYVQDAAEVTVFVGAIVGACIGFLWFNCHPAEVFMGDTGSLALGGAVGTVALLIKQEFNLFFVGGLFVVEALSVIIQVGSYRFTGKRVFHMAPLHHHFEMSGWPESKVVVRFWILASIFALLSLATLKLR